MTGGHDRSLSSMSTTEPPESSTTNFMSGREVRIVSKNKFSSGPWSFSEFINDNVRFVDKTLVIEAFLRESRSHHVILRPRRCGKSYTLSMIRLSRTAI